MWSSLSPLVRGLWIFSIFISSILLAKLCVLGLNRTYPFFASYLGFVLVTAGAIFLPLQEYTSVWFFTEPLLWLLYLVVVLELYTLVLKNYAGIAKLGRWAVMLSLLVSILISVATLGVDMNNLGSHNILQYYFVIERGVLTSLLIFMLLITMFVLWFPVSLSRNIAAYCIGYFVYFASKSMVLLFRNVWGADKTRLASTIFLGVSSACCLFWCFLLTKKGETSAVVVAPSWRPDEGQRMLRHLDSINASLIRTGRE